MTEMYRITPIERKGLGIVATKFIKRGSLILKEEPQMQHVDKPKKGTHSENEMKDYFKAIMSSFDQMSDSDKKEYLNLHSGFEGKINEKRFIKKHQFSNIVSMMEKDRDKAEKMLKIVGIYDLNAFADGVKIQTSRFNHSCLPNAINYLGGITATYDIKEGQEITINYLEGRDNWMGLRKKEYRQKFLYHSISLICLCDLCKKQHHNPTEIETEIEELIEEVEKLNVCREASLKSSTTTTPMMSYLQYPPEKCRRHIECYKKLYKFGKEKKANNYNLYKILDQGFQSASLQYQICCSNDKFQFLEEFKKECVSFAKAAEGFSKLLGKELVQPEMWRKRHQNYEKYLFEEMDKHNLI